jgi:hypothetical protein
MKILQNGSKGMHMKYICDPRQFGTIASAISVAHGGLPLPATVMGHGGGTLVLLNFEMIVYFSKMKKRNSKVHHVGD